MSTRVKKQFSIRLPADLVEWADEYAASMRWDRTTVIEAALDSFREDVAGGVPVPPRSRAKNLKESPRGEVVKEDPALLAGFEIDPSAQDNPVPDFGSLVRRGVTVPSPEPNVDHFERTDDYRRAMALFREGKPWRQLMKASRRGEES